VCTPVLVTDQNFTCPESSPSPESRVFNNQSLIASNKRAKAAKNPPKKRTHKRPAQPKTVEPTPPEHHEADSEPEHHEADP
ncbi:hypothetical protein A2U01_0005772, partial [Trifolium medium]|nr:hypothetical protein [Trifolium medium]